jgi:hypothetical protein
MIAELAGLFTRVILTLMLIFVDRVALSIIFFMAFFVKSFVSTFSWSDIIHNPLDGRAYLAQKPGLLIEKYKENGRNQHEKISYISFLNYSCQLTI